MLGVVEPFPLVIPSVDNSLSELSIFLCGVFSTLLSSHLGLAAFLFLLASSNNNVQVVYRHGLCALFGKCCCRSDRQLALWMAANEWRVRTYGGCLTCTCPAFPFLHMMPRPES